MAPQFERSIGTNRLLVFKLGGNERLPAETAQLRMIEAPPPLVADQDSLDRGADLYELHCQRCHGLNVGMGGVIRDLRYMRSGTHQLFQQIVRGGIYSGLGMVSFADVLDESQAQDIHNYLISLAQQTWEAQNEAGWWVDWRNAIYEFVGELAGPWIGPPAQHDQE